MLVQKTNPIGIDDIIDAIQLELSDACGLEDVEWDNFPRAYRNPEAYKQGRFIPEIYLSNGDYQECLMNDNVALTSFFYVTDNRDINFQDIITPFNLVVQCSDLDSIFPNINHRADEELITAFLKALNRVPGIELNKIITDVDNVYREFDTENVKFDDMGKFFVFRVEMSVRYGLDCVDNC